MLKKKTSVLIISNDGSSNQKVQVPTFFVKYWKTTLFSVIACAIVVISFVSHKVHQNNAKLAAEVETYNKKLNLLKAQNVQLSIDEANNQVNIDEVKKSMHAVDSTLNSINEKMRKRGLRTISLKNAGGPIEKEEEENLEELAKFYSKSLRDIENRLDGTPLGKPHHGRVTSRFGYRANPFTGRGRELHSGIDLKGRNGEQVKATANGTVSFAGYMGNYGYVVMVTHPNGYETRYAHLSKIRVKRGQRVVVGATVGLLGSTGRSTGPHLHYEILQNGKKLNPEKFFQL